MLNTEKHAISHQQMVIPKIENPCNTKTVTQPAQGQNQMQIKSKMKQITLQKIMKVLT